MNRQTSGFQLVSMSILISFNNKQLQGEENFCTLCDEEHKNVNFGCTEARIPFRNKEFSKQELNCDRSICMAAICYSGPISAAATKKS